MSFCVYIIINEINNKIYIGETSHPKKRWIAHKNHGKNKRYDYPLYKAMYKYGNPAFSFSIIENYESETEALDAEKYLISHFKSIGYVLYNITDGGEGTTGRVCSELTKEKISKANKGKQNRLGLSNSYEQNLNISKSLKGKSYSKKRKNSWYELKFNKKEPDGMAGIEKERNAKSEAHKGERNGKACKLKEQQVIEIKRLIKDGLSTRQIAKLFNVSKSAIADISSGRCWSHVILD
jgi:group I intron endonuclease